MFDLLRRSCDGSRPPLELPIRIGVVSDFHGDSELEDSTHFHLIERASVDAWMSKVKPSLILSDLRLERNDEGLRSLRLEFCSISDFDCDSLARQLSVQTPDSEAITSRDVALVKRHYKLQSLESNWRALHRLVQAGEGLRNIEIFVRSTRKSEFLNEAEVIENSEISLFQDSTRPDLFTALIVGFEFTHHKNDLRLLRCLGDFAIEHSTPVLSAASPALMGMDSSRDLANVRAIGRIFAMPEYTDWHSFRRSAPSQWIFLTMNRYFAREPLQVEQTQAVERIFEDCVPTNAAYALGEVLIRGLKDDGFAAKTEGYTFGGVSNLATVELKSSSGDFIQIGPTECPVAMRLALDLQRLGIACLVGDEKSHSAFFPYVTSVGGRISSESFATPTGEYFDLSSKIVAARFLHGLRAIARHRLSHQWPAAKIQSELKLWLQQYVGTSSTDWTSDSFTEFGFRPLATCDVTFEYSEDTNQYILKCQLDVNSFNRGVVKNYLSVVVFELSPDAFRLIPTSARNQNDCSSFLLLGDQDTDREFAIGQESLRRRLPFVFAVLGDFHGTTAQPILKSRRFIRVDESSIRELLHSFAPSLILKMGRDLISEEADTEIVLNFETFEDFQPEWIIRQYPHLRGRIHDYPEFVELSGLWLGLKLLVEQAARQGDTIIKVLSITKRELQKDLESAVEFDQSNLFKKLYVNEIDMPGGQPFTGVLAAYSFQNHPDDLCLIRSVSSVATAANLVFLTDVGCEFFAVDSWTDLDGIREPRLHFLTQEYEGWRNVRSDKDTESTFISFPKLVMDWPGRSLDLERAEFNVLGSFRLCADLLSTIDKCFIKQTMHVSNITHSFHCEWIVSDTTVGDCIRENGLNIIGSESNNMAISAIAICDSTSKRSLSSKVALNRIGTLLKQWTRDVLLIGPLSQDLLDKLTGYIPSHLARSALQLDPSFDASPVYLRIISNYRPQVYLRTQEFKAEVMCPEAGDKTIELNWSWRL